MRAVAVTGVVILSFAYIGSYSIFLKQADNHISVLFGSYWRAVSE